MSLFRKSWIKAGTNEVVDRELYDHSESQTPMKTLVDEAEHAELVAGLSKQLDAARRIGETKVKPDSKARK